MLSLCGVLVMAVGLLGAAPEKKPKAAAPQAMDPKAMEEMMMKAAAPGPHHERFKKLAGEWDTTVKWTMDPAQPAQESQAHSVITSLMDGRYSQEQASGESMGRPFTGMGVMGYDNTLKKYVSTWIDNMGTGIMMSSGTPDASGNVVNWSGESSDPMTGKMTKYRMVTRFLDDDHYTFEMFMKGKDGKEFRAMEISYNRHKT